MMTEPREPKYREGQVVVATTELYNDGSYPETEPDTLMVVSGCSGEIVQVGHHEEANLPIYMVDFGLCVLGCLEEEIVLEPEAEAYFAARAAAEAATESVAEPAASQAEAAGAP